MSNVILILTVIVFTVISQLILKFGQYSLYYPRNTSLAELAKMTMLNLTNVYVIACIVFTLLAGLAWLLVIQNMPLNRAYPLMSLNYVSVYVLSWLFFSEPLSWPSVVGICCIMIGTGLLGFK